MIRFSQYALIFLSTLILNFPSAGQESNSSSDLKRIPDITFETVEGNNVKLSTLNKHAYVIFLLPKPKSKSEGKKVMQYVRSWMQEINSETNNTFSLLIVEPFKTSFPFYSIQKSKLKNEVFPVVIDKRGELLDRLEVRDNLNLIIADKKMKISDRSVVHPDSLQIKKKILLIKELRQ